jgi:hypothetical protein
MPLDPKRAAAAEVEIGSCAVSTLEHCRPKPATKATAMIARQASAIDLTSEAVLAAAPGLDGRHDPATWREQLTAPVRPADTDGGELADGEGWPRRKPVGVTFRLGTKQALVLWPRAGWRQPARSPGSRQPKSSSWCCRACGSIVPILLPPRTVS